MLCKIRGRSPANVSTTVVYVLILYCMILRSGFVEPHTGNMCYVIVEGGNPLVTFSFLLVYVFVSCFALFLRSGFVEPHNGNMCYVLVEGGNPLLRRSSLVSYKTKVTNWLLPFQPSHSN